MTHFPDGITVGKPISKNQLEGEKPGKTWYVNAVDGNNSRTGLSWGSAFLTMAKAFSVLKSGDTIEFVGKIREQLVTPVQVFDVTIRGAGNRPRHADAAPVPIGRQSGATWTTPASGSTNNPLIKIMQQGWTLENFVMAGHASNACVLLFRDGGAGDLERDASHFTARGMRFASGQDGIEQSGGCYNVSILENSFHDLTGYAIKHTTGAGIAAPYRWDIIGNRFGGCVNLMGAWAARQFRVLHNHIAEITTLYFDFLTGSHNVVAFNFIDKAAANVNIAGNFRGSTSDTWHNYTVTTVATGLPA